MTVYSILEENTIFNKRYKCQPIYCKDIVLLIGTNPVFNDSKD
jgi:hypothetical protein